MSVPPVGPTPSPSKPPEELVSPALMNSPFFQMFSKTGLLPNAEQLHQIINNILKDELNQIKKDEASWKEAMRKMREEIEGND